MGPAESADPGYASVLVDVGARRTDREYHYRIPDSLRGRIQPGHRVSVPFGPRTLSGVVVSLLHRPEVEEVRDLKALLEDEPLLSPDLVELAEWISCRYLAVRIHCLKLLFPAGIKRDARLPRGRRTVVLDLPSRRIQEIKQDLARRAPAQLRVLEYLEGGRESLTQAQLAREAGVSPGAVRALLDRGVLETRRRLVSPGFSATQPDGSRPTLTDEQREATDRLIEAMDSPEPGQWLLHGVTGSGKTEVYLRLVEECLRRGRASVVLVPEISLTPQMVRWFTERLGPRVAVLHSGLKNSQRYAEWQRLRMGEASVAVGARSAVFAPLQDLGLIVVDEEHEKTYKQEESPRYHAREVARERALRSGALLVLGSATPSVETYHRAKTGGAGYLRLGSRISGQPVPRINLVDMRAELKAGNRSIFSRALRRSLVDTVSRGEQAVLLLNRRGYASFLLCRTCGLVMKCPHCAVSLTVHHTSRRLVCHYCHHSRPAPSECPKCRDTRIRPMGTGTEKVEQAIRSTIAGARVLRMDADTTSRPGSHASMYEQFRRGGADILVGTQMVAKGWDVPSVTLVGVINADVALNLPDFRSGERTYQLLTQVAGRAGRGLRPATVLVQTYNPEHPSIVAAADGDEERFYKEELQLREGLALPPYSCLARILVRGPSPETVSRTAGRVAEAARAQGTGITVLGPGPAPFERLRGQYRWHVAVKAPGREELLEALRALPLAEEERGNVRLIVDVDPESML